jgi:ferredoxin
VARPDRCNYCADCEEHCPEGAISLPYQIVSDLG